MASPRRGRRGQPTAQASSTARGNGQPPGAAHRGRGRNEHTHKRPMWRTATGQRPASGRRGTLHTSAHQSAREGDAVARCWGMTVVAPKRLSYLDGKISCRSEETTTKAEQ